MARSIGERTHKLRKLINLKCGPGAAILPPAVTRIHMDFGLKMNNGHMGPRKFWKEQLPRLKYHNPTIPMIVNRHTEQTRSPTMTIYLRKDDPSSSTSASTTSTLPPVSQPTSSRTDLSKAQPPATHERTVTIDMKDKHSTDILQSFLAETNARPLQPTPEEVKEMQELERLRKDGEVDRERNQRELAEIRREKEMLQRARDAAGLADADN